jgi:hypothetical protein
VTKVVGEVAIEVGADIGPLVREMSRGTGVMDRFDGAAKKLGRGLDRFADRTAALGAKLSIVSAAMGAVTAAAFALTKSAATMGDEIGDSAKAAGMSTTAFQEYRFALKEAAAMTDEEFASSAAKLNKTLGEARSGSEGAVKAFEAIGISQAQLADGAFTTDQAMAAFIAKMEATKDPAIAAALATDLFGKAGASLGAGLSGVPGQVGSLVDRARELGVVMGPEAVAAAGQFDQKMAELGAQFEAVKMKIAEVLLPIIVDKLIPALQEKVIPAIAAVVDKIGEWITWFGQLDPAIQTVVGAFTTAFAVGGPVLLAIAAVSSAISVLIAATGPVGLFIAAAALLGAAWVKWGDSFKAAVGGAVEWVTGKFNEFMELLDRIVAKAKEVGTAVANALKFDAGSATNTFTEDFGMGGAPSNNGNSFGGAGGAAGGQMLGAAIANGMVLGTINSLTEKRDALAAAFAQVPQIARDVLGIKSPSTVFAEIGQFLGLGMAQGITDSTGVVKTAMDGMTGQAIGSAKEGVGGVLNALGSLFQGSKKISAGIALANSWLAFTEVLKDPAYVGRPWARFAAAASALASGINAVKNINSAQPGGSGGGGGASAAAGAGGGGQAAPATTMNFTVQNDPFGFGERFARNLVSQMNDARRSGSSIIATVSSS